jgi:hypothetical protein
MIHGLGSLSLEDCSLVAEYLGICDVVSSGTTQEEDWLHRMIFIFQEIEAPLCRDFGGRRFCSTANRYLVPMPYNAKFGVMICVLYGGDIYPTFCGPVEIGSINSSVTAITWLYDKGKQ